MNPQAILEGMGWKQGEGLGRHKQGIASAIKPKVIQYQYSILIIHRDYFHFLLLYF